jgi:glycosyltransferase involved in cell wall biosynthesis
VDALVRQTDTAAHVRVSGFLPDDELALRYAAADVAVFLSDYEGFGLGVLEAMARGVPVVASERPAMGELFGAGALLVDPRDPMAVAEAVGRVLEEPGLREDLIARGRTVAGGFSWQQAAVDTWAVLEEAAAERKNHRDTETQRTD